MSARLAKLFFAWVALLALLGVELAASFLPMAPSLRPLLLVFAVAMAGVIVTYFMEVTQGPSVIRLFATAGLVWLIILLALGSLDPLTRFTYLNEIIVKRHFDTKQHVIDVQRKG